MRGHGALLLGLAGLALVAANAESVDYESYRDAAPFSRRLPQPPAPPARYHYRSQAQSDLGEYDRGQEALLAFGLLPNEAPPTSSFSPAVVPSYYEGGDGGDGGDLDQEKLIQLQRQGYVVNELDSEHAFGDRVQTQVDERPGPLFHDGKLVESQDFAAEYPNLFKTSRIVEAGSSFVPADEQYAKTFQSSFEVQKAEPVIEKDFEEVVRSQAAPIIRSSYELQRGAPVVEKDFEYVQQPDAGPVVRHVDRVEATPIIQRRYEVLPPPIIKKYEVKTQPIIQRKIEVLPPPIIKKYFKVLPPQVIKKMYKIVPPSVIKRYFKVLPPPVIKKNFRVVPPPVIKKMYNVLPAPVIRRMVNVLPPPVIKKYFQVLPPPVIERRMEMQPPPVIQKVIKVLPPPIIRNLYTPPPVVQRVYVSPRPVIQPPPIIRNVYVPRRQEAKHYLVTPPATIKNVYNVVKPEVEKVVEKPVEAPKTVEIHVVSIPALTSTTPAPTTPAPAVKQATEPPLRQIEVEEQDVKKVGKVVLVETVRRVVDAATFDSHAGYQPPPARSEETVVDKDGTVRRLEKYVVYENVPVVRKVLKTVPVSELNKQDHFLVSAKASPGSSQHSEYLVSSSPARTSQIISERFVSPSTQAPPAETWRLSTSAEPAQLPQLAQPTQLFPWRSSLPSSWASPSSYSLGGGAIAGQGLRLLSTPYAVDPGRSYSSPLGAVGNVYSSELGAAPLGSTRQLVEEPRHVSSIDAVNALFPVRTSRTLGAVSASTPRSAVEAAPQSPAQAQAVPEVRAETAAVPTVAVESITLAPATTPAVTK